MSSFQISDLQNPDDRRQTSRTTRILLPRARHQRSELDADLHRQGDTRVAPGQGRPHRVPAEDLRQISAQSQPVEPDLEVGPTRPDLDVGHGREVSGHRNPRVHRHLSRLLAQTKSGEDVSMIITFELHLLE